MTTSSTNWPLLPALALVLLSAAALRAEKPVLEAAAQTSNSATPTRYRIGLTNHSIRIETEEPGAEVLAADRGPLNRGRIVLIGQNVELKAGETADQIVVIGGSVRIHGPVSESVVVIRGNIELDSEVQDKVVAVMGNIKLRPSAIVHGDVVAVGGQLDVAPGAKIDGQTQGIDLGGMDLPGLPHLEWLRKWFVHCVLKMRPLAPQVGWVWGVAGIFALAYFLIALALPRPMRACVAELTQRPATSFLLGLLTKILAPLVFLILFCTGVGILVLPFIFAALVLGAMVGTAALLQAVGSSLGKRATGQEGFNPLLGLVLGLVVVNLLYLVPILGLLSFIMVSIWGLGCVVSATFGSLRRELPTQPAPDTSSMPPSQAPEPGTPAAFESPPASPATLSPNPYPAFTAYPGATREPAPIPPQPQTASAPPTSGPQPGAVPQSAVPEALAFEKAGFWLRMGAAFLDVVLVSILSGFASGPLTFLEGPTLGFVVALAYFAGMWTWKGTTIGGIVLGLKVVRFDGQPLTFPVALVRGLAAAFSTIVLFLGFFWIAWDPDKQGWHDRIAGTVVIRIPRSAPLLIL